jgi:hypothetical protein
VGLTPEQIDALPEYTNAQMVKLLRHALIELASSPEDAQVMVAGRQWTTHNIAQLKSTLEYFEQRAAQDVLAAAATAGDEAAYAPTVKFQEAKR